MKLVINIFFSMVLLLFPILCYLFYIVANKNIDSKKQDIVLKICLIISMFFIQTYPLDMVYNYLMVTVPLFICFKRKYNILLWASTVVVVILCFRDSIFLPYFIILEFIIALLLNKSKMLSKYILTGVVCSLSYILITGSDHFIIDLIYIFAYIIVSLLVNYTITEGEDVINYHIEYKDLKKEREIRTSLFKITHEIKNPLAVCKTYTDIFDYDDPECAKKYIPIISGEIDKMLILLQDFMLVNKDNINLEIMDINLLLEEVTDSLREMNRFKINLDCIDDEIYINGDYNRLTQVMTNLIKNGYEAHASNITVKSYIENEKIIVAIIDNGDGIKECDRENIYVPFFTTKKDGTGLGVPLSNEIVQAHGGTLKYSDNKKRGTIAKISLPIADI